MSSKSKKSSPGKTTKKDPRRPFDAKLWKRAEEIASRYSVIVQPEAEVGFLGRGVEFPNAHGDGVTEEACIRDTREAMTLVTAYMLEEGQIPPSPASEEKRDEQVNVRLSKLEKLLLEEAARSRGYRGVSDFMRAATLSATK
jgi:predicted RNase H-like HicB family nuclease